MWLPQQNEFRSRHFELAMPGGLPVLAASITMMCIDSEWKYSLVVNGISVPSCWTLRQEDVPESLRVPSEGSVRVAVSVCAHTHGDVHRAADVHLSRGMGRGCISLLPSERGLRFEDVPESLRVPSEGSVSVALSVGVHAHGD